MSQFEEQILVADGGLNFDDDPRFFKMGDTDYRLNIIPTSLGSEYVLTNLKGTTKKSHSLAHDSTYDGANYTPIGSCFDIKRNAIYVFVYSDLTNHCIVRYNIDSDTWDKIVWDNPNIGFDLDYPIDDAFMIDNWLYWNPRSSSPRAINVQWAYYDYVQDYYGWDGFETVTVGSIVTYQGRVYECIKETLDDVNRWERPDLFRFISWCYDDYPTSSSLVIRQRAFFNTTFVIESPLSIEVASDTDYEYNNLRGNSFQFTYRFYQPQLGYTVSAPYTEQYNSFNGEQYNGEILGDSTLENLLKLHVPILVNNPGGNEPYLEPVFEYLEILVRNGDSDDWRVVATIPHDDVLDSANGGFFGGRQSFRYDFRNNDAYVVTDSVQVEVSYNYLPITTSSQCAIDGERVGYGMPKEGYDTPNKDVDLTSDQIEVTISESQSGGVAQSIDITDNVYTILNTSYNPPEREIIYEYYTETITLGGSPAPSSGDVVIISVNGVEYSFTLTLSDVGSASAYADFIKDSLNTIQGFINKWSVSTGPIVIANNLLSNYSITINRYSVSISSDSLYKYKSLKTGAWHSLCMFYYDGWLRRRSEAIPLDDVYIETPAELQSSISEGTNQRRVINYSINHLPPTWATQWRFGYAGNVSVGEFWQYNITAAGYISDSNSEYYLSSYVDITSLQDLSEDANGTSKIAYPNTEIEPYTYTEGDRIRFVTQKDDSASTYNGIDIDNWSSDQHDYVITAFDSTTNYIYFNSDGIIGDGTSSTTDYNGTSVIVEIYRPKPTSEDVVYYEVGDFYGVYDNDGVSCHRGGSVDQTSYSDSATGTFEFGDVYLITRVFGTLPTGFNFYTPVFVESYSVSDFIESTGWGKGKAGATFELGQRTLNNVRYSNKYIKNTRSSAIGRFDGLDYKTLSYNYGDITAIRQIGDVLKVIFENNVASVLINKTQFYNADGTSQVVKSDDVLGSVNYAEDMWGSVNPESVLVVDRNLYFFDLRRKSFVRNAVNGSFPISDYEMKKYFIDKSDVITSSGEDNVKVYSAWDGDRGLLYVGFNNSVDSNDNDIVLFHETQNRWVTFHDVTDDDYYNDVVVPSDPLLGILPDFSLTVTDNSTYYSAVINSLGTGNFNGTAEFTASNVVDLKEGDSVRVNAYIVNASSQSISELTKLYIVGTGDVSGVVLDMVDYNSGNQYDNTTNITESSSIQLKFGLDGTESVVDADSVDVRYSVVINRNSVPLLHNSATNIFSFTEEDIHIHNDNETRCNFWEVQRDYKTRVYAVENPNIIKLFDSIALHTNAGWDVEDIQIPSTLNYPVGMQSKIPEGRFEKEEGVLRSDYLCNMKTTSSTANIPDLLNGDNLRGYIIWNDLTGDETTEHNLYKVDIKSTISKY